jgi:Flp pilus assembly protein protease CpaA
MIYDLIYSLNLAFILMLGVVTSYEDIKKNRISNKYILLAAIAAFLTNIVGNYLATAPWETKLLYIQTTIINACISLLIGFLLWHLKLWRAGDGKLFFTYAFLLPISVYYYGYVGYFPSFAILVNTIIPLFLLLILNLWVTTSTDEKYEIVKRIMNPRRFFYTFLSLITVQWLSSLLFRYILSINDVFISGSLSIVILVPLMSRFQDVLYEISPPLVLLRILLEYRTMTSIDFIAQLLLLFAFLVFILGFITNLGSFRFSERVKIMDLKPGMYCTEKITKKGKFYAKSSLNEAEILNFDYENLTYKDIKKLHTAYRTGRLKFEYLTIGQTLPFAPFLFLGTLLTLLIRGDLTTYLKLILPLYYSSFK